MRGAYSTARPPRVLENERHRVVVDRDRLPDTFHLARMGALVSSDEGS
jgi:hypothetical protein